MKRNELMSIIVMLSILTLLSFGCIETDSYVVDQFNDYNTALTADIEDLYHTLEKAELYYDMGQFDKGNEKAIEAAEKAEVLKPKLISCRTFIESHEEELYTAGADVVEIKMWIEEGISACDTCIELGEMVEEYEQYTL